jgi:hypothetical protein
MNTLAVISAPPRLSLSIDLSIPHVNVLAVVNRHAHVIEARPGDRLPKRAALRKRFFLRRGTLERVARARSV